MSAALAVGGIGWIVGWIVFAGLRRCASRPDAANVSIIIPARNEEDNLPRLLRSLPDAEIIVVDDCSTDRTREIAQRFGVRVIDGTPPPAGWRGKTWACQQGADAATGELLLFLDADTWLERPALSSAPRLREGAMSIAPYHNVPTLREQFSAFFNLVMLGAAGSSELLGQSLLIQRATYQKVGGHRAVRHEILENFALGRRLEGPTVTCLGRGILNMRMHPHSWREQIDGWSKNFADGAAQTSPLRLALIIVWITGCVVAVSHPLVYAMFVVQLAFLLRRIGSYRVPTALFYPLPLLFFFSVFARSFLGARTGEGIAWKGRAVRAA